MVCGGSIGSCGPYLKEHRELTGSDTQVLWAHLGDAQATGGTWLLWPNLPHSLLPLEGQCHQWEVGILSTWNALWLLTVVLRRTEVLSSPSWCFHPLLEVWAIRIDSLDNWVLDASEEEGSRKKGRYSPTRQHKAQSWIWRNKSCAESMTPNTLVVSLYIKTECVPRKYRVESKLIRQVSVVFIRMFQRKGPDHEGYKIARTLLGRSVLHHGLWGYLRPFRPLCFVPCSPSDLLITPSCWCVSLALWGCRESGLWNLTASSHQGCVSISCILWASSSGSQCSSHPALMPCVSPSLWVWVGCRGLLQGKEHGKTDGISLLRLGDQKMVTSVLFSLSGSPH